jgi:predicted DNA-binding protein with PD1-like motif
MGTLTGGVEIHPALVEIALTHKIQTATFEMLGGLTEVEFRAFDFEGQKRKPPIIFTRPMEIVSGHGTISLLDRQPNVHLHLAVAFGDTDAPHGISVVGGHVTRVFAHAVEITITAYDGAPVHRKMDEETGLMLWNFE